MSKPNFQDYCDHCERDIMVCGKCGMNTCSGGYGTLGNGETCDQCPSAYEESKSLYPTPTPVNSPDIEGEA